MIDGSVECVERLAIEGSLPQERSTVFLTNTIPPAERGFFVELQKRFKEFHVLLSTAHSPAREWPSHWKGLNVELQKSLNLSRTSKHPIGFSEAVSLDVPWNTFFRLKHYRPDLVISAELGFRTLCAVAYRLLYPHSRLIIWAPSSEHTEIARGTIRRFIRRRLLRHSDAVLTNGESGRRYLESLGVAREKVFFAPRSVELAPFVGIPLKRSAASSYRLMFIGRLVQLKGLIEFTASLRSWAEQHRSRQIEFWIVGEGPLYQSLQSLPVTANLSIRLLGSVPYSQIPGILGEAGILVFPSMSDEWGLVVNEAMAAGLPILGSRYSEAVEELVEPGVTGWKFRPDHRAEMDEAINRALSTPVDRLDSMRIAARQRAVALSPPVIADRVQSLADSVFQRL